MINPIKFTFLSSCLAALALVAAPQVMSQGIENEEFELEGNILDEVDSPPGTSTDWSALFTAAGQNEPTANATFPNNVRVASFKRDFVPGQTSDATTFMTGSKDVLNIGGGGQVKGNWQCGVSNNVSDKGDIIDAYAAIQIDDGEAKLLFAIERSSDRGSAKVGLWFLQDETVMCPEGSGTRDFAGNHMTGDLLIVADFDRGGNVAKVQAFMWKGGPPGYLDPTPVAEGGRCGPTSDEDTFCATVNDSSLSWPTTVPWYIESKTMTTTTTTLPPKTFFEGMLNLSHYNVLRCFNKFLANTRQSTSLTSTMFDFVLGSFNACGVTVSKACNGDATVTSGGRTFDYPFRVTVRNNGIGTLYGLKLQERAIADYSGEFCKLGATDLYAAGSPDPDDNPLVDVGSGTLGPGGILNVDITCRDRTNGFANAVRVYAKSSPGGADYDVISSYTMTTDDTCPVSVSSTIGLSKTCNSVRLVSDGGDLDVEVKVVVGLQNNGSEALDSVTFTDDRVQRSSFVQVLDSTGTPCTSTTCTTFAGTLAPTESAYFLGTYRPAAPDGNEACPGDAQFTDQVTASGVGFLSGKTIPAGPVSAHCELCVTCTP